MGNHFFLAFSPFSWKKSNTGLGYNCKWSDCLFGPIGVTYRLRCITLHMWKNINAIADSTCTILHVRATIKFQLLDDFVPWSLETFFQIRSSLQHCCEVPASISITTYYQVTEIAAIAFCIQSLHGSIIFTAGRAMPLPSNTLKQSPIVLT